jgi:hypothetical protein
LTHLPRHCIDPWGRLEGVEPPKGYCEAKSNKYFPVLASISQESEDADKDITKILEKETSKEKKEGIDPDDAAEPEQASENDDDAPNQVASKCKKAGIGFTLKKVAT